MRNIDLALLLMISPGLLLAKVTENEDVQAYGYVWLFSVTIILLVRILSDGLITRRPRLESNMNAAGMAFLCASVFLFLTTKVLHEALPSESLASLQSGKTLVAGNTAETNAANGESPTSDANLNTENTNPQPTPEQAKTGPGTPLVAMGVVQISKAVAKQNPGLPSSELDIEVLSVRILAIAAHLAIIFGLILIGRHIYSDPDLGFAMGSMYMLLPCTAYDVGQINHVLPAALVVWAIYAYRRPVVSGLLLGLASAMMFFPVFLLPLWFMFYWRRGGLRFAAAVALPMICIATCLLLLSNHSRLHLQDLWGYVPVGEIIPRAFGRIQPQGTGSATDFWVAREPAYLIPVFVSYLVMLVVLTVKPGRKSLAQIIPHSAALVIGTQFWYPWHGGVYVLWYLPLLLLTVFRPQMTNHFAPEVPASKWARKLGLVRKESQKEESSAELAAAVGTTSPGV